jgi:hypothetical protein
LSAPERRIAVEERRIVVDESFDEEGRVGTREERMRGYARIRERVKSIWAI